MGRRDLGVIIDSNLQIIFEFALQGNTAPVVISNIGYPFVLLSRTSRRR
jgi:hypothetical protein